MARRSRAVAVGAAAVAAREPVRGVVRRARRLVTLGPDWPGWEAGKSESAIDAIIGGDMASGTLVRAYPPAGTPAERLDEVRTQLAGAGVAAARFMPAARAEGIGVAKARREQPTRVRPRDVVMQLAERSASTRKPAVLAVLDEILTGVGL